MGAGGKPSGEPPAANMKNMNYKINEESEDDILNIYDDIFDHAMHLLNDHQKSPELVAGTMMAIAQRIYRTQMNDEEYREMMDIIKDAPVKPFKRTKMKLH